MDTTRRYPAGPSGVDAARGDAAPERSGDASRETAHEAGRDRAAAVLAATAAVVSRAAVAAAAAWRIGHGGVVPVEARIRNVRYAEALHGYAGNVIDSLAHRDGVWFVRIASQGYEHAHSQAFFPLYPLLTRIVSPLTAGNYVIAGEAVSLAAYAAAMVLLYKLVRPRFGAAAAAWTVAFISWFPLSFVFSAVYSEALFLLFTVAAFWFGERRTWWAAGLAGLLAAATRETGLLLVVPLLLLYASHRGWGRRRLDLRWPRDLRIGWLLLVPLGTLLYMAYLQLRFGSALLFSRAQSNWRRSLGDPVTTVVNGVHRASDAIRQMAHLPESLAASLAPDQTGQLLLVSFIAPVVGLVIAVVFVALAARRLPLAYTAWAVVGILAPLFFPSAGAPLYSLHRFVLVLFPVFIAAALATRRLPALRWLLLALSAIGLVWYTTVFAAFAPIG